MGSKPLDREELKREEERSKGWGMVYRSRKQAEDCYVLMYEGDTEAFKWGSHLLRTFKGLVDVEVDRVAAREAERVRRRRERKATCLAKSNVFMMFEEEEDCDGYIMAISEDSEELPEELVERIAKVSGKSSVSGMVEVAEGSKGAELYEKWQREQSEPADDEDRSDAKGPPDKSADTIFLMLDQDRLAKAMDLIKIGDKDTQNLSDD